MVFLRVIQRFVTKHTFALLTIGIFLLAIIVRFYNFDARWGLGNDDARDVAIALEALKRGEFPLVGSFSSAGAFVFGPFFYWFIMLSFILFPFSLLSPWVFLGIVGLGTVGILMYCGYYIAGKKFALLVGLLAATSPQLVARSLSLGQHSFVAFFAACMALCFILFFQKKKLLCAFLVGLCAGIAINFHYQALNLVFFVPMLLFVTGKSFTFRVLAIVLAGLGVLLALSPLILWDSQQQFANFRNLFEYFLVGQYRIYVPNSWRLFFFTQLPAFWSFIIGGYTPVVFILFVVLAGTTSMSVLKKNYPRVLLLMLIPFIVLLLLNKFYKGERSEGYLLYFLPFVILFTSYALYIFFQKGTLFALRKFVAIGLIVIVLLGNLFILHATFTYQSKVASVEKSIDVLVERYPNKKFVVYDYKAGLSSYNQPLSLLLDQRGLISKDGMPIGVLCHGKCPKYPKHPEITLLDGLAIVNLSNVQNIENQKKNWVNVNPQNMYDDLIGWSQRHELKSNFSIEKYLTDTFNF